MLLQRYHSTPGRTIATLQSFTDDDDRSSYQVLAAHLDAVPRDHQVLDLACGDGFLLKLLAHRGFTGLTGVDSSRHELDAARGRLGQAARLLCQDARAVELAADSIDVVVCHMALMLMEPVESVLAEVARLLKPGGRFVAVINRAMEADPAYDVYRRELHRVTAEAGMKRLRLGDRRMFTVAGLTELFSGSPFADEDLQIEDFCVRTRATPVALWTMLRLMYDVFRLPDAAQSTLEQRLITGWRRLCDDSGRVTCSLAMRLLACRTPNLDDRVTEP